MTIGEERLPEAAWKWKSLEKLKEQVQFGKLISKD